MDRESRRAPGRRTPVAGRFETHATSRYTRPVRLESLPALVLAGFGALAIPAGCDPRSPGVAAVRCAAPDPALPGAAAFPPSLAAAVAAADVPAGALLSDRRTCNRLALESGAFARRHALDPIDWRVWSRQSLDEAAASGLPVLALTGDASCAECNALGRDALSSADLARTINERFVPLLVDRHAQPDVDAYLMLATQVLTGGAGWPAIVVLLPDGRPFAAESWGAAATTVKQPDRLVTEVARRIDLGGGMIAERAEGTFEKMARRAAIDSSGPLPDAAKTAASLVGYAGASFDAEAGAFGPPPWFPRAPLMDFLVERGRRGDAAALAIATTALERLQGSPLEDRARGGFFRFARAGRWQDPAPEKFLADNAALARTYLKAGEATGRRDFLETARRTVGFLLGDLRLPGGAFAASLATDGTPAPRDERVLADANAVAISALARGSAVLADPVLLEAAVTAARELDARLRDGGSVVHCAIDAQRCGDGYLADHTLLALAFLDLHEATAHGEDGRWLEAARAIADELPARFGHEASGGFFQTAAGTGTLPLRLEPAVDRAAASGNSAAALLFVRLAERDGRYRETARRTFEAFSETLELRPLALPSMVAALARFAEPQPAAIEPLQLEPAPAVQP